MGRTHRAPNTSGGSRCSRPCSACRVRGQAGPPDFVWAARVGQGEQPRRRAGSASQRRGGEGGQHVRRPSMEAGSQAQALPACCYASWPLTRRTASRCSPCNVLATMRLILQGGQGGQVGRPAGRQRARGWAGENETYGEPRLHGMSACTPMRSPKYHRAPCAALLPHRMSSCPPMPPPPPLPSPELRGFCRSMQSTSATQPRSGAAPCCPCCPRCCCCCCCAGGG